MHVGAAGCPWKRFCSESGHMWAPRGPFAYPGSGTCPTIFPEHRKHPSYLPPVGGIESIVSFFLFLLFESHSRGLGPREALKLSFLPAIVGEIQCDAYGPASVTIQHCFFVTLRCICSHVFPSPSSARCIGFNVVVCSQDVGGLKPNHRLAAFCTGSSPFLHTHRSAFSWRPALNGAPGVCHGQSSCSRGSGRCLCIRYMGS